MTDEVPWTAPARMLFADSDELMTLKEAVLAWRELPAVTHALVEIQTDDMRSRAETYSPEQIEMLSRYRARNGG